MELEFFCEPGTDLEWFQYWRQYCIDWLKSLGIKEDEMRARDHSPEELCFYSKGTTDIAQKTIDVKAEADKVTSEVAKCDETAGRLSEEISVFKVD